MPRIKSLIKKAQRAFQRDHNLLWKHYTHALKWSILQAKIWVTHNKLSQAETNSSSWYATARQLMDIPRRKTIARSTFLVLRIWIQQLTGMITKHFGDICLSGTAVKKVHPRPIVFGSWCHCMLDKTCCKCLFVCCDWCSNFFFHEGGRGQSANATRCHRQDY